MSLLGASAVWGDRVVRRVCLMEIPGGRIHDPAEDTDEVQEGNPGYGAIRGDAPVRAAVLMGGDDDILPAPDRVGGLTLTDLVSVDQDSGVGVLGVDSHNVLGLAEDRRASGKAGDAEAQHDGGYLPHVVYPLLLRRRLTAKGQRQPIPAISVTGINCRLSPHSRAGTIGDLNPRSEMCPPFGELSALLRAVPGEAKINFYSSTSFCSLQGL